MLSTQFLDYQTNFDGIKPDSTGVLSTQGSVRFASDVINATAAIKSFRVSYGIGDYESISVTGASYSNLQFIGSEVSFNLSTQIYDGGGHPHYAEPADSNITVTIIANCE